jgi:hypothetical protein
MEQDKIITEFKLIDEFGSGTTMSKETTLDGTENGMTDVYFLYEQFVSFLKACGFSDKTISMIQLIENEDIDEY